MELIDVEEVFYTKTGQKIKNEAIDDNVDKTTHNLYLKTELTEDGIPKIVKRPRREELDEATLTKMSQNYEKEILTEAIKQNDGNLSAAGRSLGVSPRMMNYRLTRAGIGNKEVKA